MRLALVGNKISYSISPKVHKTIAGKLGNACEYQIMDCNENQLDATISKLLISADGFNITKPFKQAVAKYCNFFSDDVKKTDSINCIKCGDSVCAANTDLQAFKNSLEICGQRISKNDRVLILGAGGAASSIAEALSESKLYIFNRTIEHAKKITNKYNAEISIGSGEQYDYIINCTPIGQNGEDVLHISDQMLQTSKACIDLIYKDTPFLLRAQKLGIQTINGLVMLVDQARLSWDFWTGEKSDISLTQSVVKDMRTW